MRKVMGNSRTHHLLRLWRNPLPSHQRLYNVLWEHIAHQPVCRHRRRCSDSGAASPPVTPQARWEAMLPKAWTTSASAGKWGCCHAGCCPSTAWKGHCIQRGRPAPSRSGGDLSRQQAAEALAPGLGTPAAGAPSRANSRGGAAARLHRRHRWRRAARARCPARVGGGERGTRRR